jgi:hypothetical protein
MKMTVDDYIELLRQSGCFDFLCRQAVADVEEIILRSPGVAELLSDGAKKDLETGLCRRMEPVYFHPMMLRLQDIIKEINPAEGMIMTEIGYDTAECAAQRMRDLMGPDAGSVLEEEYPLIRDYTSRIRQNYIAAETEMLGNITTHKQEISDHLFGGQPIEEIQMISTDSGDMHRHGRTVQRIATDAGAFYYKPHDCRLDALYKEIVNAVLPDCTLAPVVVLGDNCGFEEELKAKVLKSSEQISEYFYNFGMLTALFHALGSTDMHGENIMACGSYPSAIDLETLVRGRVSKAALTDHPRLTPLTLVEEDLNYCVDNIGILPNTVIRGLFFSALHHGNSGSLSLPNWQGKEFEVVGYEQDYIRGFRTGYDKVLASRDLILGVMQKNSKMTYRFVPKNTTYYYYFKTKLYEADSMKNTEARDAMLKRLEVPYTKRNMPVNRNVVDYEVQCLCEGDIPYFCAAAGSHDLCGVDTEHVLISGYWDVSAQQVLHTRIQRLSPEERDFETDYIIKRLNHAPLPEEKPVECTALPDKALSEADAHTICETLLNELESDGVRTSCGTMIWHSGTQDIEKDPNCGFITHIAEASFFCAKILTEPSLSSLHEKAGRIVKSCMEQLQAYAKQLEGESPEYLHAVIPLGQDFGMGRILLAIKASAEAGMTDAQGLADRFLKIICRNHMYQDKRQAGGEAGLVLAADAISDLISSDELITQLMTGCADAMLEQAPSEFPMTEAMRGAAFAKAFCRTGDERYRQGAFAAFQHVQEAYLSHISGWPEKKPAIAWLAESGGQEGGITLCAMMAATETGLDPAATVRDLGLASLRKTTKLSHSDSLYNGNALRVLGLIRSAERAGQKEDLECAGRLLSDMVLRREQNGCFICSPKGIRSFFDVSVSRGSLGVGYTVLAYLKAMRLFS